jgi:hypothetical protein
MTLYEALIKVEVNASRDEKVSAIRMGLHETAARLVSEYEVGADDVREWLEEAAEFADDEARS